MTYVHVHVLNAFRLELGVIRVITWITCFIHDQFTALMRVYTWVYSHGRSSFQEAGLSGILLISLHFHPKKKKYLSNEKEQTTKDWQKAHVGLHSDQEDF